jgi:hypothetical protein
MQHRHYSPAEYQKCEGEPLSIARLVEIWRGLHERDRLGFVLSLDEPIADKVIEATAAPATAPAERENH